VALRRMGRRAEEMERRRRIWRVANGRIVALPLQWCVTQTVYGYHRSLIRDVDNLEAKNKGLSAERDDLKAENERLKQAPQVVTRTLPAREEEKRCWLSDHFGMPNSTVKGAVTATAAIIHCNQKIDAPFEVAVEFDRNFIPGAMTLPDTGGWMGGVGEKQGKKFVSKIISPALLSEQLVVVTVYGETDQYPRALRANVQALK
jgi:cell division protein FtsB